jgi:hypothetical protein
MSCSVEILNALAMHSEGLTCDELTEHCPSAEGDSILIGRVISQLRTEQKVHGAGARGGRVIYKVGTAPNLINKSGPWPHQPAAQRGNSDETDNEEEDEVMARPLKAKILAYLKANGPSGPTAIADALKDKRAKAEAKLLVKEKVLNSHGSGRGTKYGLPGQKVADANPPARAAEKKPGRAASKTRKRRAAAPQPRARANGNGTAAFAIDAHGCLGLMKDERRVDLDPEEFAELRDFIDRTEQVWKPNA